MNRIDALRQTAGRGIDCLWRERPRFVNNPIINRELITQLRKKQSFAYLFLFLAAASIVFLLGWSAFIRKLPSDHTGNTARQLMMLLSATQGAILLLFTPLISATAVNLENERETWELLLTSPLGLANIIVGKLLSSFVFTGFILLSIAPVISMTMPMGGVSPFEIAIVFVALIEGIVIMALIGLYGSIRFRATHQSITFTYILSSIYFIGLPLIPTILCRNTGFWVTLSPAMPVLYVTAPQAINVLWGVISVNQAVALHVVAVLSVAGIFLFLSAWHLAPQTKERTEVWCRKLLIGVGTLAGKAWVSILGFWAIVAGILTVVFQQGGYIHFDQSTLLYFLIVAAAFLLLFFPLASTVFFYVQWEKKPWGEVGATPRTLERMLYRCIWHPVATYGKWMLGISFFFLVIFYNNPSTVQNGLWFVLFGADAVLYIAIIGMACSLFTNNAFHAVAHCYSIAGFYFFFLPLAVGHYFRISVSPIYLAFAPHFIDGWNRPFSQLLVNNNAEWTGFDRLTNLFFHLGFTIILFVVVLMFCQRRLLKRAGFFERETLWHWIERNLYNRKPKFSLLPTGALIPFFSEAGNPVALRELREYFIYRRSKFVTSLIWLILTSMILFWIVPVIAPLGPEIYRTIEAPLGIALFLSPFFVAPFAAGLFRRERDQGTWDMLSTTTLTSHKIIQGKLISGFCLFNIRYGAFLLPIAIIGFIFWKYGGSTYGTTWYLLLVFLSVGYPYFLFMLSFSAYVSAKTDRTPTAYIFALITPYLFIFAPFFFGTSYKTREINDWFSPLHLFMDYRDKAAAEWWANSLCFQILLFLILSGLFYTLTHVRLARKE